MVIIWMVDGKCEFKGKVIGIDSCLDIVLVKVDVSGLFIVKMGSLVLVWFGQWVVVIGLLFGFFNIIMVGIVSVIG